MLTHAWDEFYRTYSTLLRRFAAKRRIAADRIADLLQTVWAEVVSRLPELQLDGANPRLRAWMYTLLRSKAIDLARREAFRATVPLTEPTCR